MCLMTIICLILIFFYSPHSLYKQIITIIYNNINVIVPVDAPISSNEDKVYTLMKCYAIMAINRCGLFKNRHSMDKVPFIFTKQLFNEIKFKETKIEGYILSIEIVDFLLTGRDIEHNVALSIIGSVNSKLDLRAEMIKFINNNVEVFPLRYTTKYSTLEQLYRT